MSFNLKDFFAGIVYLFVIFLPGATFLLLLPYAVPVITKSDAFNTVADLEGVWSVLIFFGLSYYVGHLISLFSSWLEDFAWKNSERVKQRRLRLDEVSKDTRRYVQQLLGEEVGIRTIDANPGALRSWCRLMLRKDGGPLDVDIERKDADRRFFRNILLVTSVAVLGFLFQYFRHRGELIDLPAGSVSAESYLPAAAVLAALTVLSYRRYEDQDAKYTRLLFASYLALRKKPLVAGHPDLTHAGAVIWQKTEKTDKFLVVRPSTGGDEWVLPKGHIEVGESAEAAAKREIAEEVGLDVDLMELADVAHFRTADESVTVAYFLAAYSRDIPAIEDRKKEWTDYSSALNMLSHRESRQALEKAHKLLLDRRKGERNGFLASLKKWLRRSSSP